MSTNLLGAHHQWATRPNDERFWGLTDMGEAMLKVKENSREKETVAGSLKAISHKYEDSGKTDLVVTGTRGGTVFPLTHWSMGQVCSYAGAPAEYMRRLPPSLAATNINYGLEQYKDEKAQLMFMRNDDGTMTLRSMTTKYSRLWNTEIVRNLEPALQLGWMTPPARPVREDPRARPATIADIVPGQDAFGLSVKVGDMIAPAGCYASDRDMFAFLVNPQRVVDLDGDSLMRGVFVWNSEVGAGAFKVQAFYLEAVCGNHIVWGAKNVITKRIVHKGKNFKSFASRFASDVKALTDSNTSDERVMVQRAKAYVLGKDKDEVVEELYDKRKIGLSKVVLEASYDIAEQYEHTAHAAPNTAWGMSHAITRFSQRAPYMDEKLKIDNAAGKLLQLAYTAKS